MPSHRVKTHDLQVADPNRHADLAEWTAQRGSDKPFTLAEAMCSGLGFQDRCLSPGTSNAAPQPACGYSVITAGTVAPGQSAGPSAGLAVSGGVNPRLNGAS